MTELEGIAGFARATQAAGRLRESEALEEFEAYLMGEMLRMATRSSSSVPLSDGGSAGRMYRELFYEELGRLAARRDGLGLAQQLRATEGKGGA